jgi:hypothetical protein
MTAFFHLPTSFAIFFPLVYNLRNRFLLSATIAKPASAWRLRLSFWVSGRNALPPLPHRHNSEASHPHVRDPGVWESCSTPFRGPPVVYCTRAP